MQNVLWGCPREAGVGEGGRCHSCLSESAGGETQLPQTPPAKTSLLPSLGTYASGWNSIQGKVFLTSGKGAPAELPPAGPCEQQRRAGFWHRTLHGLAGSCSHQGPSPVELLFSSVQAGQAASTRGGPRGPCSSVPGEGASFWQERGLRALLTKAHLLSNRPSSQAVAATEAHAAQGSFHAAGTWEPRKAHPALQTAAPLLTPLKAVETMWCSSEEACEWLMARRGSAGKTMSQPFSCSLRLRGPSEGTITWRRAQRAVCQRHTSWRAEGEPVQR